MTYNFTKLCCLFIGGALLLAAIGCHKHNDVVAPPTTTPPANGGKDTITLGATITLSAATATTTGSTYAWTVNGTSASTDTTFAFTPTVRGDYAIVYSVTNQGGSSKQNFNIHVFGKYENGFFIRCTTKALMGAAPERWVSSGTIRRVWRTACIQK